jgi:hypothetical protein
VNRKENRMSTSMLAAVAAAAGTGAAATPTDGVAKADHDKAVATARAEGKAEGIAEGAKAATDRFAAVLGAEGIKGDAARMSAAIDLAVKAPAMAAADVVSFVTGNVGGGAGASLGEKMASLGNPALGTGAASGGGDKKPGILALAEARKAARRA